MKIFGKNLALAAVALSLPLFAGAQNTQSPQNSDNAESAAMNTAGSNEAAQMVPVNALLSRALDARKDHPGSLIQAKLMHSAHLSNGIELPSGTILMGSVVQDDLQQKGTSKLALRFDQARLKDGKVVPIHAMIVSILGPTYDETYLSDAPNLWTASTLQVDQLNVVPGVDLHSQIGSQNSGVFVTTKKDDVKLSRGSEVQLALGPAGTQPS
jgi:hypothetical protein